MEGRTQRRRQRIEVERERRADVQESGERTQPEEAAPSEEGVALPGATRSEDAEDVREVDVEARVVEEPDPDLVREVLVREAPAPEGDAYVPEGFDGPLTREALGPEDAVTQVDAGRSDSGFGGSGPHAGTGPGTAPPVDELRDRPGVPMEADPERTARSRRPEPVPQQGAEEHLRRAELERPTPVVGTAQPLRGLSGLMRRTAYRIPERFARHWMLLVLADRVDVVEDQVGSLLSRPLDRVGFTGAGNRARSNPLAVLAGVALGSWIVGRAFRGRR